jgi:hypothetical protein
MFKHIPFLGLLLLAFSTYSQPASDALGDYEPEKARTSKMIFSLAGHGDLEWANEITVYPGMVADAAYRIWYNDKLKKPRIIGRDSKTVERDLFVKAYVGFYKRPHFHTAVFVGPEIAFRLTTVSGIYGEVGFGAGYMHTIYNEPVYELQSNGTFEKVRAGEPHVIIGGNFTGGFDFSKMTGAPLAIFAGFGLNQSYPNNMQWTKHPYVRMGISFVMRKEKEGK